VIETEGYWDAKIVVHGVLEAVGTKEKRIEFHAKKPGYWGGITFEGEKAGGRVEHCLLQNGRAAAIACEGASPVIRENELVTEMYGQGWIFCEKGSKAVIEGNRIEGAGTAVVCEGASPEIKGNTFKGCGIGIRLFGFAKGVEKPRMEGNTLEGRGLAVFDEGAEAGDMLKQVFASEEIVRGMRLTVTREGKRDTVMVESAVEGKREVTRYRLSQGEKGYELSKGETTAGEESGEGSKEPTEIEGKDGTKYRVVTVMSGGGVVGREGCSDTKPAYVVVVSGERKASKIVWRSEQLDRGYLLTAAADLDGDGVKELVVADGRWCEGKGRVYVYRQEATK